METLTITNGTEKQINWANDIKRDVVVGKIVNHIETADYIEDEYRTAIIEKLYEAGKDAKFWIDNKDYFTGHSSDFEQREYTENKSKTVVTEVLAPLFA